MFPPAQPSRAIPRGSSSRAVKSLTETIFLQPVNPLEHPDWDAPLTRRPDFSFFHGAALCETEKYFQPLFQKAVELGRSRQWKSVELRGGRKFLGEAPASLSFYGHSLNLVADELRMFEKMDGSARQAVRKAERDGVIVEVSQSAAAVRDFYVLQCRTRKRHGLPPQPFSFFLNIWRHILSLNQGMVVLASQGGEKIGGAVYFFLGGRAIYKFGASDFRRQHLRPNNLVMWTAMKWLARNGATTLHLGKTSLANEGLRKFKLNLGAVEQRIEYVKVDLQANRFVVETRTEEQTP